MEKRLTHAAIAKLSTGTRQQREEFLRSWPELPLGERRRVVRTMSQLAEDDVTLDFNDLFLGFLGDADPEVRMVAVEGLWEDDRSSTADRLMALAREDGAVDVRATALKALSRFALRVALGEVRAPLADRIRGLLLESTSEAQPLPVRRRAIETLGYVADDESLAIVRAAHRSTTPGLRASAVAAMGRTANPSWLDTILREMHSDDAEVRFEAVQAAGEIESESAVPSLIDATRDDDREVRLAAVAALGAIGGRQARDALIRLARSDDEAMSEAADTALEDLEVSSDPLGVRVRDVNPN